MKEKQFKAEFHRRLFKLHQALNVYFETGKIGSLLPYLFSVCSYLWCKDPFKK